MTCGNDTSSTTTTAHRLCNGLPRLPSIVAPFRMPNFKIKEKLMKYETLRINEARRSQARGNSKNNPWLPPVAGKAKGALLAHSCFECHQDTNLKSSSQAHAAGTAGDAKVAIGPGPNDRCNYEGREKYKHLNKECFAQHPELRRKNCR